MSVIKDKERKDYVVRLSYKKPDGKYGLISKRVKKFSETKDVMDELKAKVKRHITHFSSLSFNEASYYFFNWLDSNRRASSASSTKRIFRLYILPRIGKNKLFTFSPDSARSWKSWVSNQISDKSRKKLSINSLNYVYFALHGFFRFAKSEYSYSNDSISIAGPFKKDPNAVEDKKDLSFWSIDEFNAFSNAFKKRLVGLDKTSKEYFVRWSSFVELNALFFSGMRKGEANALLVSDFHDCKHPYLSITKSVSLKLRRETGKPWLITMPKNNSSVRDIPIPDALASLIREHIEERLKRIEGYNESFFLFGGIRPIPDTTLEMEKQISEKNSGVKHIRIHDLRHSYASMLINSNVPITVISRLLGHTSIEMTWKVYSHLYPTTSNEAIDVINSQLKKTFYTNFTPEN